MGALIPLAITRLIDLVSLPQAPDRDAGRLERLRREADFVELVMPGRASALLDTAERAA